MKHTRKILAALLVVMTLLVSLVVAVIPASAASGSTWYVAGNTSYIGANWTANSSSNKMSLSSGTTYTKSYTGVPAGNYEFKVTNGTWGTAYGDNGGNYKFQLISGNSKNVTIGFNTNGDKIYVYATEFNRSQKAVVYVKNAANWSNVYAHAWSGDGGTSWPGTKATLVDSANKIYKVEVAAGRSLIIFNNNSGTQTNNLVIPTNQCSLYNNSTKTWSKYHAETETTTVAATCTTAGSTIEKCKACGEVIKTTEIPALGHNVMTDAAVDATCTTTGLTAGQHCSRCDGETVAQEVIAALGHNYVNGVCSRCDATDPSYCAHEYTYDCDKRCIHCEEITRPDVDHSITHVEAKPASCTENGNDEYWACSVCNYVWADEALTQQTNAMNVVRPAGHDIVADNAVNPTCTKSGLTAGEHCSRCDDATVAQEVVAALGHKWVDATCTAPKTCSVCSATEGEALDHTYTNGYCSCGKFDLEDTVTIYFENNWKWSNINVYYWYGDKNNSWPGTSIGSSIGKNESGDYDIYSFELPKYVTGFVINGTKNNSTESDQTPDIKSGWDNCVCYYMFYSEGNLVKTYEYHVEETVTTEATCTENGSKVTTCSVCEKSSSETIPALGHNEVVDAAVAPKCETTGLTEGKHCSECNKVLVAQTVVDATGHLNQTTAIVDSTCTVAGYTTVTCDDCGETLSTTALPLAAHTAGEAIKENEVAATCKAEGSYDSVVKCSVCNAEMNRTNETIAKLPHTEVVDAAKAATCTEPGLTEGKHCDVCGTVTDAQEVVPATGHSYNSVVTAPTFGAQGYTTHTCSNCGHSYVDSYVDAKAPTGKFSYRGYVNDSADREAVAFDLENVGAGESVVIKLYDANGNLLTTTTLKAGGVEAASYTCNIVLWGRASGSWETVISAEKLTVANIPATAELWCDGVLVDTYENALGAGTNVDQVPNYCALECVYKEAKVGNTYYATLQAAFDAAVSGDTVTLLADIAASKYIDIYTANNGEVARTLVLDLNGHTISPAEGYNYNTGYPLVFLGINQTLTLKGEGTITAEKKVTVGVYGVLNVESGNIVNNGKADTDAALAIYYWNFDDPGYAGIVGGTAYVSGGSFVGDVYCDEADEDGRAVLEISGGKFTTDVSDYCADGFDCAQNADGSYGIIDHVHSYNAVVTAPTFDAQGYTTHTCACGDSYVDNYVPALVAVAKIGEDRFVSIQAAVEAANTGDVITLVADVELDESIVVDGKEITLDLAGYTVTAAFDAKITEVVLAKNTTKLTITGNGSMIAKESENTEYVEVISAIDGAIVVIENGSFVSDGCTAIYATRGAVITINGGYYEAKSLYYGMKFLLDINEAESVLGQIKVNGGSFYNFDPSNHNNDGAANSNKLTAGLHAIKNADNVYVVGAHSYNAVVTAPTCTEDGYTTYTCACGDKYVADKTPATGHNYVDGVCSCGNSLIKIGEVSYENLAEALAAAKDGDVIVLNDDIVYDGYVSFSADAIIDLNGNTLTADAILIFSGNGAIVDNGATKGLLAVPRGYIMANHGSESSMLPVWNEEGTGYVLVNTVGQTKPVEEIDEDSFAIECRPSISGGGVTTSEIFGNGALDNDITFGFVINFINGGEVVQSLNVKISDELIARVHTNQSSIRLIVNGVTDAYDEYEVVLVINSNVGLSYSTSVGVYVPAKSSDEE